MKELNNDNFSIDEILNDVKRLTGQDTGEEKLWSLAEIDALLGDDKKAEETETVPAEPEAAEEYDDEVSLMDFAKEHAIDYNIEAAAEALAKASTDAQKELVAKKKLWEKYDKAKEKAAKKAKK